MKSWQYLVISGAVGIGSLIFILRGLAYTHFDEATWSTVVNYSNDTAIGLLLMAAMIIIFGYGVYKTVKTSN